MRFFFYFFFHLILVCCAVAQFEYNLAECIAIALENKKTLKSAELDVRFAEKEVFASYAKRYFHINTFLNNNRF